MRDAPAVSDQSGNARDQADRFANVSVMRVVAQIFIEGAQHRYAGAQQIHRMSLTRQKPQHFGHRTRQRALGGNLLCELDQLFAIGQLAVKQQVSDFLKAGLVRHLMNVIAAIHQPSIRIDPADCRFPSNYTCQPGAIIWFGFLIHQCVSITRD